MKAQAEIAGLQAKDLTQSVFQAVEYVLGGISEEDVRDNSGTNRLYKGVSERVNAYGDS